MGMMDILQVGPWAYYAGGSPVAKGLNAMMQGYQNAEDRTLAKKEKERLAKLQEMQMQAQLQAQALAEQERQKKAMMEQAYQERLGLMGAPQLGAERSPIPQMTEALPNSGLMPLGNPEFTNAPTRDVLPSQLEQISGNDPYKQSILSLLPFMPPDKGIELLSKISPTGNNDLSDLVKTGKYTPESVEKYKKTGSVSDLVLSEKKKDNWTDPYVTDVGGKKVLVQKNTETNETKKVGEDVSITVKPGKDGMGSKKPLPYQAIKAVNEEVENIGISKGIQSDLQGFVTQLDTGTLKLGPMENLKNTALNKANQSTEASRNYGSFMSNLEKLRNDSLRLNKGIQTEGDAQRAWKELISNVTDQKFVRQRLKEIQTINERAIKLRQQKINNITKNYNKDDYDFSDIEDLPSATNLQSKPRFTIKKVK